MALPTNSAGPDAPTDSSAIDGVLGLGNDDQEIRNWLVGLSPSGAVAHDTGWVDIALASGYTADSGSAPQVRRIGKIVYVRGQVAPSSGNFATGTDLVVGTIPDGFRPPRSWADRYTPLWPNPTINTPVSGAAYPNGNLVIRVPPTITNASSVQVSPVGPYPVD